MNTLQIVSRIRDEASGPSYSVLELTRHLQRYGETRLLVLDDDKGIEFVTSFKTDPGLQKLGVSTAMKNWLRENGSEGVDVIHTHGLWMMPNVYPGNCHPAKLVVSPRGTLSSRALSVSKTRKRLFWYTSQRAVLMSAAMFHATAEHELADIRQLGFTQPVCVIPNAVEIADKDRLGKGKKVPAKRKLLYLGRLNPIKGLEALLHAWARLSDEFPDWVLEISGPDEDGYRKKLEDLAVSLRCKNMTIQGPKYGTQKADAYIEAELFVLPSESENFGMTIAEAMAHGTPVVTTSATPWGELDQRLAGWCYATGTETLYLQLRHAMSQPGELLSKMGMNGYEWMQDDYTWERVSEQMNLAYEWLLSGGAAPPWVHCTDSSTKEMEVARWSLGG